mmetsp:Transcript_916/g.2326  ORF Transcript_916/g.2326 Transcript_916/m.2326 type:complete len:311 (+) Transcript_916:539-1471(+)
MDPHVAGGEFLRPARGQSLQREFRGHVQRILLQSDLSGLGGNVENHLGRGRLVVVVHLPRRSVLADCRRDQLRTQHVEFQQELELASLQRADGSLGGLRSPRVVDDDVDVPLLGNDGLHRGLDLRLVRDVAHAVDHAGRGFACGCGSDSRGGAASHGNGIDEFGHRRLGSARLGSTPGPTGPHASVSAHSGSHRRRPPAGPAGQQRRGRLGLSQPSGPSVLLVILVVGVIAAGRQPDRFLQFALGPRRDNHVGTLVVADQGDRPANSTTASGDQYPLTLQKLRGGGGQGTTHQGHGNHRCQHRERDHRKR